MDFISLWNAMSMTESAIELAAPGEYCGYDGVGLAEGDHSWPVSPLCEPAAFPGIPVRAGLRRTIEARFGGAGVAQPPSSIGTSLDTFILLYLNII